MNQVTKALTVVALLAGFAIPAHAKTDGILVVGTQEEVKAILAGTSLRPTFQETDSGAMVAVRLTHGKMTVYEGEPVKDILRFVGNVVKGGVVFTLKVGSGLWNLLEDTVGFVFHVGEAALKGACWVLSHATCLVVNGVSFVVHTTVQILRIIGDLLHCAIHCP